ncbi:MAG: YggS family pyridoxal phosphate-dependent enzyme [Elusimicrobia bacterium]|nr:YggS family pyridoxal phosphate-dependent enzyme [Elusimicrobiota bacterium]
MLIDNLKQIRYSMRAAAQRAGRNPDAIRLVAVTKYASLEQVRAVLESGLVEEAGESRVQDAEKRKTSLGNLAGRVRWRMLGHLQTNKAKKAAEVFDAIDTVDSDRLAAALDSAPLAAQKFLPVLIQVKLSSRETQSGATPEELPELLAAVARRPHLKIEGLMAIAPHLDPVESVRPYFRALRELRDRHLPGGLLSMGMSRDFELAIEEGSDMVRVGSQIFSQPSTASLEAPA